MVTHVGLWIAALCYCGCRLLENLGRHVNRLNKGEFEEFDGNPSVTVPGNVDGEHRIADQSARLDSECRQGLR